MTAWHPPEHAPCVVVRHQIGAAATSALFSPERVDIIDRTPIPGYTAGRDAKDLCRVCPAWAECATDKIRRNEKLTIMGGVGGSLHRALRRAWGTPAWGAALAAHGRRLHGETPEPGDAELLAAHGAEAECGRRGKAAKGCRCSSCALAAAVEGALGGSFKSAVAGWIEANGEAA